MKYIVSLFLMFSVSNVLAGEGAIYLNITKNNPPVAAVQLTGSVAGDLYKLLKKKVDFQRIQGDGEYGTLYKGKHILCFSFYGTGSGCSFVVNRDGLLFPAQMSASTTDPTTRIANAKSEELPTGEVKVSFRGGAAEELNSLLVQGEKGVEKNITCVRELVNIRTNLYSYSCSVIVNSLGFARAN